MPNPSIKRILIAAGGTGGHVFPGIAVARALQARGIHVGWLGTRHGLDAKLVPQANIPFSQLSITGLRGKGKLSWLMAPFKLAQAIYQAINIIRRTKADAVLGMGGYVSGPAGIAAWLLRKPLYIHEQNALAGMTNRHLAKLARTVFAAFPHAFAVSSKVIITGNPVRADILALPARVNYAEGSQHRPLHLLILGGSQGAVAINRLIPSLRQHFTAEQVAIWHQTGAKDFTATGQKYQEVHALQNDSLKVAPFIDNMAEAYRWADVVICRAGALTVAELAAAGLPSILIPFPYAVDDHQTHNALYLQQGGAAVLLPEKELSRTQLTTLITDYFQHPEQLANMALAARKLAILDATERVVEGVLKSYMTNNAAKY